MNHLRLGNTKDVPYINTGVLLINLAKLREVPVAQDIENFMKRRKHLLLPDQDILSSLYGDHILLLNHFIYNLSDRIRNIYNIEHPQQSVISNGSVSIPSSFTSVVHISPGSPLTMDVSNISMIN